ncbi:MAG TPA: exodeoxyribonuclease III, partial [Candidatus Polarisedimenticolaceae bacterium]|nr:exodeoxyribonuclease III [Candidatus Polarisedimenticolaceae bacterium]
MRVASWNVNGLRARIDLVLRWLVERRPDVVGLQELKLTDDQFPHDRFLEHGYRAAVHGQKAWNGVAVLSRDEAEVVQRGLPGQTAAGARMLEVRSGALRFATVYVPNGKSVGHTDFATKLSWLDALAGWLRDGGRTAEPFVLCGDFNLCPAPLDSWNEALLAGSIFHTDDERSRFRALLDCGLHDLFRELEPQAQAFSWWDYRGGAFHRKQGLRIDFLLASGTIRQRLRSVAG